MCISAVCLQLISAKDCNGYQMCIIVYVHHLTFSTKYLQYGKNHSQTQLQASLGTLPDSKFYRPKESCSSSSNIFYSTPHPWHIFTFPNQIQKQSWAALHLGPLWISFACSTSADALILSSYQEEGKQGFTAAVCVRTSKASSAWPVKAKNRHQLEWYQSGSEALR